MELWIRSQDKMGVYKVNEEIMIHHYLKNDAKPRERMKSCFTALNNNEVQSVTYDKNQYEPHICIDKKPVGCYKSEERALEVLDEINTHKDELLKNVKSLNDTWTYEMPLE